MKPADLQRRRERVARVNAKRPAGPEVRVILVEDEDRWQHVARVLVAMLDTPPTPREGR